MKTATIVYARLDSHRLPGKALRNFAGLPLLEIVLRRAFQCELDRVIFATSQRSVDDPLCELAVSLGAELVRGSFENLVSRTVQVLDEHQIDLFARVNGDCPFLDPDLIVHAMRLLLEGNEYLMATNLQPRTFPYGVAVEVVRSKGYRELADQALPDELEHTTKHLYRLIDACKVYSIVREGDSLAKERLTVDTIDDALRLSNFFAATGSDPLTATYFDVLSHWKNSSEES